MSIGRLHKDFAKKIVEFLCFAQIPAEALVAGRPFYHISSSLSTWQIAQKMS
jgi:hypothetical protein